MKFSILLIMFICSLYSDEIYIIDGVDDLDIIAKEGWVFVEDSAFVDINSSRSKKIEDKPKIDLFNSYKTGCGSDVLTHNKSGCKSSR